MWVRQEEQGHLRVGLTKNAQHEQGDVVYVELPAIGKRVEEGQEIAVLESTKAATDIYSPVTGIVVAVNEKLRASPELINRDPEGEGWLCQLRPCQEAMLVSDCER